MAKLGADGSMVYSTYFGGKASTITGDRAQGIAADAAGNAYVEGDTSSLDFPTAPNGPTGSNVGRVFVTRINSTGSAFGYTRLSAVSHCRRRQRAGFRYRGGPGGQRLRHRRCIQHYFPRHV